MVAVPLRSLGSGIVPDRDPDTLPPGAWSSGKNVRFEAGSVRRAPIYRVVQSPVTPTEPVFIHGLRNGGGFDRLLYADRDGRLYSRQAGVETEVSPLGFTPVSSLSPHTAGSIAKVPVINRPTAVPVYLPPGGANFVVLPGWDSSWRCAAMRPYLDYLFALNVTKGLTEYPIMAKWSDAAHAVGQPPSSWDEADTTKRAGEKRMSGLTAPLIDGLQLGNQFMIYSGDEVWAAAWVGGTYVFDWRRLYEGGVISQNCVVEVGSPPRHYVFGPTDLYWHDGIAPVSIARRLGGWKGIYPHLRTQSAHACFVAHYERLHEVWFFFPSDHPDVQWPSGAYANRAAVYNYWDDSLTFVDAPNVSAASTANLQAGGTYASAEASGLTYEDAGGTYASVSSGGLDRHMVTINAPDTTDGIAGRTIHGVEPIEGSTLALPLDDTTFAPAYVERKHLNLDMLGELMMLRGTKLVRHLYTHMTADVPVTWRVGTSGSFNVEPTWSSPQTFAPGSAYRIDTRHTGRLLSYRMDAQEVGDFRLFGLDLDVVPLGGR